MFDFWIKCLRFEFKWNLGIFLYGFFVWIVEVVKWLMVGFCFVWDNLWFVGCCELVGFFFFVEVDCNCMIFFFG